MRRVVRGFVEPRYTAAHPDGVHAFVTDSGRSSLAVVDTRRGTVVDRVRLPGWARHVTISRDGSRVWVGLGSASDHVAVVSTAPLRHVGNLTPGFLAHDVGLAPDDPHSARAKVCPTTGLSIEKVARGARRRRYTETARNRAGGDEIGRVAATAMPARSKLVATSKRKPERLISPRFRIA